MFMDELMPLFKELTQQPIAFMGGFVSGIFRLNLMDDPVKSWLDQQTGSTSFSSHNPTHNGKSGGPQSISID
ncbi:MAG: hypothetical protein NW220_05035 [Leptolyngbyaceae cyanobacterium bins.349]|nr:hypothetical protein [Leptolyngbyaceae cyanobacterium bins.349]